MIPNQILHTIRLITPTILCESLVFSDDWLIFEKFMRTVTVLGCGNGVSYYRNIIGVMSSPRRTGNELQSIKQPEKVKVLILSESKASLKDFYLITTFTKLIKIDLSYNKLTVFPPGFSFKTFNNLRTLFLHYNKFNTIKHLLPVTECQSLQYFTLFGNPLEQAKARHFFINQMPSLMLMDDKPIRLDERNPDFSFRERIVPLLTFPLTAVPTTEQPHSKIYIQILIQELAIVRRVYLSANPVIQIQRWWRNCLRKKQCKWKNVITKPIQEPIPPQKSLREYKQTLENMAAEQVQSVKPEEKLHSLLWANRCFWKVMESVVQSGRLFLTRQYCMLRGIHFQEIPGILIVKHANNITGSPLSKQRRLLFFLQWHHQLVIKKYTKNTNQKKETAKQISLKVADEYRINRNRFIHNQQKLIRREEQYRRYVLPHLTKEEQFSIVKKQYWRLMRAMLNEVYCELPFILESLADRVRAAVSIQRLWRGYRVRKSVNAFLKIKEKESAIKIQRWIRRLRFIHRHKFLLEVSHYLKGQRNAQITLEMSQLEAIETYATYKEIFSHNFTIPFQECNFSIMRYTNNQIIFHSERKPYPPYLGLSFAVGDGERPKTDRSSILQILFKQVREVNKVTDSKGVKFVRFVFESIQQALNRKFILALKTYRMINHQFIRSRETPNVPAQYVIDLLAELNQNRLVTMMYDSPDKQEMIEQAKKLEASRSQGSLASDFAMVNNALTVKIKYYIVKSDRSCTLFLREPNYQRQEKHPMQLHLKQFYMGRRSSKRYADEDNSAEMTSKISRNILCLEDVEPLQPKRDTSGGNYNKILNTDQSHTILDPEPNYRSLNRLQSYRKSDSYDRFDKEVYPPTTTEARELQRWQMEGEGLREKREKIEEIKAAHKKNIESISLQKTENLTNLRRSIRRESQDRIRRIDDARSLLEQEKARKHDRVREHFKSSSSNFEKEFLKKGIGSIKRGFRDFEKHRPTREPLPVSPPPVPTLKTQIKQFSISFESDQIPKDAVRKSIQGYSSSPTNKSQNTQILGRLQSMAQVEQQDTMAEQKKAGDLQRKKLRKKRLVHSVFPEEFYPIKQSNQIGFQLPRIIKK